VREAQLSQDTAPQAERLELTVPSEEAGTRLDTYLARAVPDLSRSRAERLIEEGHVLVDGRPARPATRVQAGSRVIVELPPPEPLALVPEPIPLRIVYEDPEILVIEKPAGLVVHPAPGHPTGTLVHALLGHAESLAESDDPTRPGIVHRLDKDTSGLMVVAKTERARLWLVDQFAQRRVHKRYLALLAGAVTPDEGVIDAPIGRHPVHRQRMAIVPEARGGRPARTAYRVLERFPGYTLVEAFPETGRTHQIRVHFASQGWPVVGDPVYGGRRATRAAEALGLARQFLHAADLRFTLPDGREYSFHSELPDDLAAVLDRLRQGERRGGATS
jgi:23S rRNA pseudouridine1911/1915/1917 synthase